MRLRLLGGGNVRKDFKEVLIDRPRSGGSKTYRNIRRGEKPKDADALPENQGMRRPYDPGYQRKEFSDHIGPLKRWLRKQVGRPWNKIWSEICQVVDSRDVIGKHLLDHAKQEVDFKEEHNRTRYHPLYKAPLFVDKKGFLRANKTKKYAKRGEIPVKMEKKGVIYKRIDKDWYSVKESRRDVFTKEGLFIGSIPIEYSTQLSQKRIKSLGLPVPKDTK